MNCSNRSEKDRVSKREMSGSVNSGLPLLTPPLAPFLLNRNEERSLFKRSIEVMLELVQVNVAGPSSRRCLLSKIAGESVQVAMRSQPTDALRMDDEWFSAANRVEDRFKNECSPGPRTLNIACRYRRIQTRRCLSLGSVVGFDPC